MEHQDLRIYNLFPRLCGGVREWAGAAVRAREMGFNALYLNPVHETGASGSIYSIRDHESYDPVVFPGLSRTEAEAQLVEFLDFCRAAGLRVFCDLVINHTAMDSPLVSQHPDWYEREADGSVRCAGTFTFEGVYIQWKDCAKLDFSRPKSGLWEFIVQLCRKYLALGFSGFRCDVAAHVPAKFWRYLIDALRQECPQVLFLGEAFLASPEQIHALAKAGFQYIFNSACWWDYRASWLIQQNNRDRERIGSISFPENHDTQRCMAAEGGDPGRVRLRLKLTGLLTSGWMITSGFEYGWEKRLHVRLTRAEDREPVRYDFSDDIRAVMRLRDEYPVFHADGELELLPSDDSRVTLLSKTASGQQALLLLNVSEQEILLPAAHFADRFPYHELPAQVVLKPWELRFFTDRVQQAADLPANESYCLESPGKMVLRQRPLKPLREGEALVKILACGVCGSDLREIRGGRFYWRRPDEGGHEWTGRVLSAASPEDGARPGETVIFRLPRQGVGMVQGGGFSRYAVVRSDCLVPLTEQDDPVRSTMIEPLAVAVRAVRALGAQKNVAVAGSGTLALLTVRLLRVLAPECRVTLVYKHASACRYADGAIRCLPFDAERPPEGWDAALECSGSADSLPFLLRHLRRGGRLLLLGIYGDAPPVNFSDVMFRELTIQGSFLYEEDDFQTAVQLVRSGALRVDDLIRAVPFSRAPEAFSTRSGERVKIVLTHDDQ